uniref:Protein asunder n=1 Tax=Trichuris muris TaxID=70415 RepID=A0A5S6R400_TRIMR
MSLLKTVFLLDRNDYTVNTTAKTFEVEVFKADEGTEQRFFQVPRTFWSCFVEAVLEYRRIVRDLFSETSHFCFVASGHPCRAIGETWSEELDQTQLLQKFAKLSKGEPNATETFGYADALSTVANILCAASPRQLESMRRREAVSNDCRLIAISHIEKKEDLVAFFQRVRDEVASANAKVSSSSVANNLPIGSLTTCLINVWSGQGPPPELKSVEGVQVDAPFEVKPATSAGNVHHAESSFVFELYNPCSMEELLASTYLLVQKHHRLGSTTVCNIPMKEEQQFSSGKSSRTYDVELVHPIEAFVDLWKWGLTDDDVFRQRHPSSITYKTLRLEWGNPLLKSNVELQNMTTRAVRCTPVQLNSRESICLTSFILGGRAISLELQVDQLAKRMTHIMQCHGKIIYMHSVALGTSPVSLLFPSHRSAARHGNNYRVKDFVHFCKTATLTPAGSRVAERCSNNEENQNERQMELKRRTNFWPLTIGESSIFTNSTFFEPILSTALKPDLTDKQLADCQKVVSLFSNSYEKRDGSQWIQCSSWKALSTEEQFSKTWSDLEQYTFNHVHLSKNHRQLHDMIASCAKKAKRTNEEDGMEVVDVKEEETSPVTNGSMKVTVNVQTKRPTEAVTNFESLNGQTVLSYWDKNLYKPRWTKWRDFEARVQCSSDRVKLYVDVLSKVEEEIKRGDTYALNERIGRR